MADRKKWKSAFDFELSRYFIYGIFIPFVVHHKITWQVIQMSSKNFTLFPIFLTLYRKNRAWIVKFEHWGGRCAQLGLIFGQKWLYLK